MVAAKEAIIAIKDHDSRRPPRKVLRIMASRDGSYSIWSPYHPAATGLLYKGRLSPIVASIPYAVPAEISEQHRVDVPVKLSLHASGFVQFSAVGRSKVRSGRSRFLVPKGLGIQSQDILNPIETGPTWMATFFELSECQRVDGTEKAPIIQFGDQDFFERDDHDLEGRHVYMVEGFVLPANLRREARFGGSGWVINREYSTIRPDWVMDFRVVELPTSVAFLGIVVSLLHGPRDLHRGYMLGGPKDIVTGHTLQGFFPLPDPVDPDRNLPSLEYVSEPVAPVAAASRLANVYRRTRCS